MCYKPVHDSCNQYSCSEREGVYNGYGVREKEVSKTQLAPA